MLGFAYEASMPLNAAGQHLAAKSSQAVITQLPGSHAEHPWQHQLEPKAMCCERLTLLPHNSCCVALRQPIAACMASGCTLTW